MLLWLLSSVRLDVELAAFFMGVSYRRKVAEAEMGSAEEEAKRIVSDALKTAESKKKESLVEAKDEIFKMRTDAERELKERRNEVQRQERRISQKEESLDRKLENLEQKDEKLQNKLKQADETLAESEQIKARQLEELERISGFTAETAKAYLLSNLEETLVHEKAIKINQFDQQFREEAEQRPGSISLLQFNAALPIMCQRPQCQWLTYRTTK